MKTYGRYKTSFSTRPHSVLPDHTRCQSNVNYSAAKRVLPRSELKRKRQRVALFQFSAQTIKCQRRRSALRQYSDKHPSPGVCPPLGEADKHLRRSLVPGRYMTVFVKTPAGEIQLQLKQEAPASVLYTEVEQHTGIPASDYKILYQGKWPVCPLLSLSDQAVEKNSTLELCLSLQGGGDKRKDENVLDEEQPDGKLKKFHQIMIGKPSKTSSSTTDPFLTVERRNLSPAILSQCFQRAKSEQTGLTPHLATFMIDLLKRRRSLGALTDYDELEKASDGEVTVESIAELIDEVADYCEFRHKELLISLLQTCPRKGWSRLMSLAAQVGCPCPFLYPVINSQGFTELKLIPDAYSDVLCLPEYPLVLSCGVPSCTGKGKTDLLSLLFGFPTDAEETALESHPGGPCHHLSIDLAFQGVINKSLDTFVVADAHGYSSDSNRYKAALTALASGAVITLIHVMSTDFSSDGKPNPEVEELLHCCCSSTISGKKCSVMILWRDFSKVKHHEDKMKKAESSLRSFCPWLQDLDLHHFGVPDMTKQNKLDRGTLVKQLSANVAAIISECNGGGPLRKMPNAKVLRTNCAKLLPSAASHDSSVTSAGTQSEWDSIGDEVQRLLNAAAAQCGQSTLFEILFPLSTIDSYLAKLNDKGDRITRDRTLDGKAYQELDGIQKTLKKQEGKRAKCVISALVHYFANIAVSGKVEAIQEFSRQINIWKEPRCRPYVENRSKLHSDLEKRVTELKKEGQAEKSDKKLQQIKKEIQMNAANLDRYDISIDDVWSEVMSLSTHYITRDDNKISLLQQHCRVDPATIQSAYCDCVVAGHPMQLLRGHPLYMAGDFLSNVLLSIQQKQKRKLFVVSVIGMQSSAKSTLLNYLFGCGFATRAGRCTRGLYASYMSTKDVDILVLDSEGLMSVEGPSREFDNEVTLMVMACSHIVIINQKGEIHRQLRELLEVSLFCLKHLKESVLRLTPDILFVLRDQAELEPKALEKQFYDMREALTDQGGKLDVNVNEFIDLSTRALYLFPSAFDTKERKGKTFKAPAALFSEKVLNLRRDLFKRHDSKLQGPGGISKEFSSMQSWVNHAKTVWTSIRKYGGNLVYYQNLHEIQQRKAVAVIFKEIVEKRIENENGYDVQCEQLLTKHLNSDSLDVTSGRAGKELKRSLHAKETAATAEVEKLLEEKLQGQDYPVQFSQEFGQKLVWRIQEKSETIWASWTYFEATMKAAKEPENIEAAMRIEMDSLFRERGSNMPQQDLESNFERMWQEKVGNVKCSFKAQWLADDRLVEEINTLFASQVAISKDKDVYTVLRTSLNEIPAKSSLMLYCSDSEWNEYMITNSWWITEKARKLFGKGATEAQARTSAINEARQQIVLCFTSERMRSMFKGDWKLDTSFMEKLLSMTVGMIEKFDVYLKNVHSGRFGVDKTTFGNDIHDCLRRRIFDEYRERRNRELKARNEELDNLKVKIRIRIVRRLCGLEDDKNRAYDLVDKIAIGVKNPWLARKVAIFRTAVQTDLQKKMLTAGEAAQEAFDVSFGSGNWEGVKKYCSNAPAYLESIYHERFQRISSQQKSKALDEVQNTLKIAFKHFDEQVEKWGTSANPDKTTTKSLITYCSGKGSGVDLQLVDYVSECIDVSNPAIFAHAFKTACQELVSVEMLVEEAKRSLEEKLQEVNNTIWSTAQGCSAVCPLCSAKCTGDRGHYPIMKHDCTLHLYPAFGGVRSLETQKPIFGLCTSKENVKGRYIRGSDKDAKLRPLKEHYQKYYPEWVVPTEELNRKNDVDLRKAWVMTKGYFVEKYQMVDGTPSDWE